MHQQCGTFDTGDCQTQCSHVQCAGAGRVPTDAPLQVCCVWRRRALQRAAYLWVWQ